MPEQTTSSPAPTAPQAIDTDSDRVAEESMDSGDDLSTGGDAGELPSGPQQQPPSDCEAGFEGCLCIGTAQACANGLDCVVASDGSARCVADPTVESRASMFVLSYLSIVLAAFANTF